MLYICGDYYCYYYINVIWTVGGLYVCRIEPITKRFEYDLFGINECCLWMFFDEDEGEK